MIRESELEELNFKCWTDLQFNLYTENTLAEF